jgi:hypothetical protein
MTTGYTREQLAELARQLYENAPPEMTSADKNKAAKVLDASMAATDIGILLRLGFKKAATIDFFLNCAVMVELVQGLHAAGEAHGWWRHEYNDKPGFKLDPPTPDDLPLALQIISLRTASEPNGLLIAFRDGLEVLRLYMRRKTAGEMLAAIAQANKRAQWWDDDFALIPNDGTKLQ